VAEPLDDVALVTLEVLGGEEVLVEVDGMAGGAEEEDVEEAVQEGGMMGDDVIGEEVAMGEEEGGKKTTVKANTRFHGGRIVTEGIVPDRSGRGPLETGADGDEGQEGGGALQGEPEEEAGDAVEVPMGIEKGNDRGGEDGGNEGEVGRGGGGTRVTYSRLTRRNKGRGEGRHGEIGGPEGSGFVTEGFKFVCVGVTKGFELVTEGFEFVCVRVTKGFELVTEGFEFVGMGLTEALEFVGMGLTEALEFVGKVEGSEGQGGGGVVGSARETRAADGSDVPCAVGGAREGAAAGGADEGIGHGEGVCGQRGIKKGKWKTIYKGMGTIVCTGGPGISRGGRRRDAF